MKGIVEGSFSIRLTETYVEWGKDFSAYYEKKKQLPEDSSRDAVIRRTAEIRKSLLPDYSGIPPTTTNEVKEATDRTLSAKQS